MGACGWTVETCGCGDCWTSHTPAVRERATALAVGHMWAATGRQYGLCEVTVVVCNPGTADPLYQTFGVVGGDPGAGPYIDTAGAWRNRGCGGSCTCNAACQLELPAPVDSIVEVVVASEAVDPDAYEVHNNTWLVRIDGACWPTCGSLTPDYGMSVTYRRGTPIPADVQAATEQLACQFAAACSGGACSLPQRLVSLSRQGVDIQVAQADPTTGWWLTNIAFVDQVIGVHNPLHAAGRSEILSPDLPQHRLVTAVGSS